MNEAGPPVKAIKTGKRAAWMAGDFGVIAKTVAGAGQSFVERLQVPAGSRVLDVATGKGNLAIPLARGGAQVTGLDIAPNLLVQARERAAAEGLEITYDEGDAESLPYADASFDVVVSMFGAKFAPRPALVASELARVLKPGGLLAIGELESCKLLRADVQGGGDACSVTAGCAAAGAVGRSGDCAGASQSLLRRDDDRTGSYRLRHADGCGSYGGVLPALLRTHACCIWPAGRDRAGGARG